MEPSWPTITDKEDTRPILQGGKRARESRGREREQETAEEKEREGEREQGRERESKR